MKIEFDFELPEGESICAMLSVCAVILFLICLKGCMIDDATERLKINASAVSQKSESK